MGNFVEPKSVVDYQRELYLNGKLPWFGSATLTSKLNADGTLTESTATSDTKLAEGLSTLLPLKEFLSGEFVDTVAAPADEAVAGLMESVSADTAKERTTVSLSVEEKGYLYAFEADHVDPDGLCAEVESGAQSLAAIQFSLSTGAYKRTALGAAATTAAKKKDAIEFSGSVTMPKAAGAPSGG